VAIMIIILSKNDSESNICTAYLLDQVKGFRSDIESATTIILDAFLGEMSKYRTVMNELLTRTNTTRTKKHEHSRVLVHSYMLIKRNQSLMNGGAFGQITRLSSTSIDKFIFAKELIELQANEEIETIQNTTRQAKAAKFPLGEKERKYLDPGMEVNRSEYPECCYCHHPYINQPLLNFKVNNNNVQTVREYGAQKEKLKQWKQNSSVNEQPTCPTTGNKLSKIGEGEGKEMTRVTEVST